MKTRLQMQLKLEDYKDDDIEAKIRQKRNRLIREHLRKKHNNILKRLDNIHKKLNQVKNLRFLKPNFIIYFLKNEIISLKFGKHLLRVIIEYGDYEDIDDLKLALRFYTILSKKDQKLFKYLELTAITHEWSKLRMESLMLLIYYYKDRSGHIINWVLEHESKICYYFIYYYDDITLQKVGELVEDKIIKKAFMKNIETSTRKEYLNQKFYK